MSITNRVHRSPATGILGLALFLAAAVYLPAQQADPSVRAARLSDVEGSVQLTQGSQIIADPALVNAPLFEGMEISTKEDGRAEIQLDDGSVARVSPNSTLKIARLKQQGGVTGAELVLESGLAYFELSGDTSTHRTIARFGDSSVNASGFTVLRISLDNLPGELSVFSGNAHLDRGSSLSLDLHGGESVALNASDPNLYNLAETIEPDSWDAWNADRDQQLTTQQAARTEASGSQPNSNNPAWSDLDANGNWYNVPDQGYVWSPNEASSGDWEPYGCGNWMWTPQFGYVWVSCEQWGYLPYSSGYWNFYDGFGWGWTPGFGYPWWQTGGWGSNIGNRPVRYQPPHRPHGGPVRPPSEPIHRGGFYQPNPVIAVNRIPGSPAANPVHVVGRPVTISGTVVQPLRPISPRPTYNPSGAAGFTRSAQGSGNPGYGNPGHGTGFRPAQPAYGAGLRPAPAQPAYGTGLIPAQPANSRSGFVPWANSGGGSHPGTGAAPAAPGGSYRAPAPSPGYSGGSSAPHPSTGGGGGGRVSSGGGGGGGGRATGGGGGGGGGGRAGGGGGAAAPAGGHH